MWVRVSLISDKLGFPRRILALLFLEFSSEFCLRNFLPIFFQFSYPSIHEDTPWILLTVQSKRRCLCYVQCSVRHEPQHDSSRRTGSPRSSFLPFVHFFISRVKKPTQRKFLSENIPGLASDFVWRNICDRSSSSSKLFLVASSEIERRRTSVSGEKERRHASIENHAS